jgi:hypothetical protein
LRRVSHHIRLNPDLARTLPGAAAVLVPGSHAQNRSGFELVTELEPFATSRDNGRDREMWFGIPRARLSGDGRGDGIQIHRLVYRKMVALGG